jgi:hypothetical protein
MSAKRRFGSALFQEAALDTVRYNLVLRTGSERRYQAAAGLALGESDAFSSRIARDASS